MQAKMFFAKDKLRIETSAGAHGGGVVIMNFSTQTSIVMMAQQHMYMDMPVQTQSQRMGYASAFFQTPATWRMRAATGRKWGQTDRQLP